MSLKYTRVLTGSHHHCGSRPASYYTRYQHTAFGVVLVFVPLGLSWWLPWYRTHLQCGRPRFDPWVGKIPWRREWPLVANLKRIDHRLLYYVCDTREISVSWIATFGKENIVLAGFCGICAWDTQEEALKRKCVKWLKSNSILGLNSHDDSLKLIFAMRIVSLVLSNLMCGWVGIWGPLICNWASGQCKVHWLNKDAFKHFFSLTQLQKTCFRFVRMQENV